MNNASKIFSAVVITLLAIIMLFTLAGCGGYGRTEPMSVRISFGEEFMEAAGVTPQEWLEYLQEQNKEGRAAVFTEGDVVILQVMENDVYDWEVLGINNLNEVCQAFTDIDESCSIELFGNNAIADVSYDEDVSRETAEKYIAQVRKWCAYIYEFDRYRFNMLEQVNYPDEPPAAGESAYGISFKRVVCSYSTFDNENDIPIISYTVYSDGSVYVERENTDGGMQEAEGFKLTEEQVQTIKDALRRHRVWTVGQIDDFAYSAGRYIDFFDEEGVYIFEARCGGYGPASEIFNIAADKISDILTSEYPLPMQPLDEEDEPVISFGASFMETAGLKPYEWREYLKDENKDGLADIYIEDSVVMLQTAEENLQEWELLGQTQLEEACKAFEKLDESCSIELYGNNSAAYVSYDENVSRETVEEHIAQVKKWCAYLYELDYNKYNRLKDVIYPDTPPMDEVKYGISFDKIVCTCTVSREGFDEPIHYTVFADNTVDVERGTGSFVVKLASFDITDEQMQSIKETLRRDEVWTAGKWEEEEEDVYSYISFYDFDGVGYDYCGGTNPTSEILNKAFDEILDILTEEYPLPAQQ